MNEQGFWNIIESIKDFEDPEQVLEQELMKLQTDEILAFQQHFDHFYNKAYQWHLWGAAYIISGGCSDDGFIDFRYGLISRGKEVYENALENPDSLAELGADVEIENELFGYVAQQVYEKKTGKELPESIQNFSDQPQGEQWDFDDDEENRKRLPKLMQVHWEYSA